jgi:hypothetical protein
VKNKENDDSSIKRKRKEIDELVIKESELDASIKAFETNRSKRNEREIFMFDFFF